MAMMLLNLCMQSSLRCIGGFERYIKRHSNLSILDHRSELEAYIGETPLHLEYIEDKFDIFHRWKYKGPKFS